MVSHKRTTADSDCLPWLLPFCLNADVFTRLIFLGGDGLLHENAQGRRGVGAAGGLERRWRDARQLRERPVRQGRSLLDFELFFWFLSPGTFLCLFFVARFFLLASLFFFSRIVCLSLFFLFFFSSSVSLVLLVPTHPPTHPPGTNFHHFL